MASLAAGFGGEGSSTEASAAPLLVITGPTASGKSALAVAFAEKHGAEVLSMDSMAVYRGMDVGTAKPTAEERARVVHHLLDLVAPSESFDTSRWCDAAAAAVEDVRGRGKVPLFVGGTPLYLMAFFKGLIEGPAADLELRGRLEAREAEQPGVLWEELMRRDPEAAGRIHARDVRRLVRALEYLEHTGVKISERQTTFWGEGWARECRIVAVKRTRDELHERVKVRTRKMLADGLVAEVKGIVGSGGFSREAGSAIGYREALGWLAGKYKDEEELRNMIRRATHRLVRRQVTWLRRVPGMVWVAAEEGVEGVERGLGCG